MINKSEIHDIFSKFREGDSTQFELLYKNYNQLVYKIAFSILKNKEASEDVTQTVFTKIYDLKLKKDKLPSSKEATWLYAVTKNEAISYLRKEKPSIALEEIYSEDENVECKDIQNIIDEEKYKKIISGLSFKEKEIVSLKIIGGLSFKEISKILNEPVGTVQWRYYKALNSLKLLLGNISMFAITLTLYISCMKNKNNEIIKPITNTEQNYIQNNSQTTENSKTEDQEDISQDNQKQNEIDNIQMDNKNENILENNTINTIEQTEFATKDETINKIKSNVLLSTSSVFLVLTIIFTIICAKHQQNRKK